MVSQVAFLSKPEPLTHAAMTNTNLSSEDITIVQNAATCALRFAYHNTVDAPLPATFKALLKQLAGRRGEDLFSTGSRERRSDFKLSR
jgi:hypothetical protein